jgi:S-adenosylmethionine:tRNA ribosyltransferase-isomerase
MTVDTKNIHIGEYDYPLPDERIAKFPLEKRDESKLLVYRSGQIEERVFKELPSVLPEGSLLVYNNTKVIQARMLFRKESGAKIEIFCLEPAEPHDYALIFQQTVSCVWTCMIGNLKKWKTGELVKKVLVKGKEIDVRAEKLEQVGENHLVRFTWDDTEATFADILEAGGVLPIPPYLHRETEESDLRTYQTVYSKIKGSVAAPTAGLHFTPEVLAEVDKRGIGREEVTLHVGAGTFKPVKSETIEHHTMHTEFISVRKEAIERIKENLGKVIAVGTTSVRTLETLYYVGVILSRDEDPTEEDMIVSQWMPYSEDNNRLTTEEALDNILRYLERHQLTRLVTATRILIAPGYDFHVVRGIVTNFHQPKSTLLLLVSAFVDGDWKSIYDYALGHGFRFLSYGDSSLLLRE